MKMTTNISDKLYQEIRKALTFDQKRNREEFHAFTNSLPLHLRLDLSMEVHRQ